MPPRRPADTLDPADPDPGSHPRPSPRSPKRRPRRKPVEEILLPSQRLVAVLDGPPPAGVRLRIVVEGVGEPAWPDGRRGRGGLRHPRAPAARGRAGAPRDPRIHPHPTGPEGPPDVSRPAVFLDRSGTLIREPDYPLDPAPSSSCPGWARRSTAFGAPASSWWWSRTSRALRGGSSRSRSTAPVASRVDRPSGRRRRPPRPHRVLPASPALTGPCDCRKPGTGMHLRAAEALDVDLSRSWCVGDQVRPAPGPHPGHGGRGPGAHGARLRIEAPPPPPGRTWPT
jgi:D-glycero-D-manno-heptose 1,7-bisphosphate phosphatase